jgi:hypothetical protein
MVSESVTKEFSQQFLPVHLKIVSGVPKNCGECTYFDGIMIWYGQIRWCSLSITILVRRRWLPVCLVMR